MKVIFEYEDGTYRIVPISLSRIEDRNQNNCLIDEYIVDKDLKKMYIIADDNHLGPLDTHKDMLDLVEEEEACRYKLQLIDSAKSFYLRLVTKSGEDCFVKRKKQENPYLQDLSMEILRRGKIPPLEELVKKCQN